MRGIQYWLFDRQRTVYDKEGISAVYSVRADEFAVFTLNIFFGCTVFTLHILYLRIRLGVISVVHIFCNAE